MHSDTEHLNSDLEERRRRAVPRGVASATSLFAARAQNAEIWDVSGRRYIDFAGGIGTLATGHLHPEVVRAVEQQLRRFSHTAFQVMAYEPYIELAEALNDIAPFKGPALTVLFTTGAEAVENAVKIARVATGRTAVIGFSGAFHGRTALTLALTGKVAPYKHAVPSGGSNVYRAPFPIDHQGVTVQQSLDALQRIFHEDVEPAGVAAIIVEPVQGEGGFHCAPAAFLHALRALCDQHGIVMIADEVQCGFGRTGTMFAVEHSRVEPDLVVVAKSLAGGFPLSGVIGRETIMDRVAPGGLGGTYGGSPIGCAAALAVLRILKSENLLARADRIGALIRSHLLSLSDSVQGRIAHVRGLGAMVAFDVLTDKGAPEAACAKKVVAGALSNGLILLMCGSHGESIRMLVPLTISDALLSEGLDILKLSLKQLFGS